MNIHRRADDTPLPEAELEQANEAAEEPPRSSKPVLVYILILFVVAFLLIAYSALVQQHSQITALDKLSDNLTAAQEVQNLQERIIELQGQLEAEEKQNRDLSDQLEDLQQEYEYSATAALDAQEAQNALYALYTLQQQYLTRDFDGCRATLAEMEASSLYDALPTEARDGKATSPAMRYRQLREAINKLPTEPPAAAAEPTDNG